MTYQQAGIFPATTALANLLAESTTGYLAIDDSRKRVVALLLLACAHHSLATGRVQPQAKHPAIAGHHGRRHFEGCRGGFFLITPPMTPETVTPF